MTKDDATLQERLRAVQLELKAPKNRRNEFGEFNYRSAEDIEAALKPLLDAQGLTLMLTDTIEHIGERYYIRAEAVVFLDTHSLKAEGWAREVETKTKSDPAQITGMASSYARKYALGGLFLIDDQPDPDADKPDPLKAAKTRVWQLLTAQMGEDAAKAEVEAIKAREEFQDTPEFWHRIASAYTNHEEPA